MNTANTVTLTLDGVVASVELALALANASLPAGTAATDLLSVDVYDSGHDRIMAPGGWVDANGDPVTVTVATSDDGGCGAPGIGKTTLDKTTFTGSSGTTANLAYDGNEITTTTLHATVDHGIANPGTIGSATLGYVPTFGKQVRLSDISDYLATGPDGGLWATETTSAKIARIDTKAGTFAEYSSKLAAEQSAPQGIIAGADGDMWFADGATNGAIGVMTTGGTVANKYVLTPNTISPTRSKNPLQIVLGPDGNYWFTEAFFNAIGRITPGATAQTSIVSYTIPSGTDTQPQGITVGPDKNIWFTERLGKNVGYVAPATGAITEVPFPPAANGSEYPYDITSGSDGNLWFSQTDNHINRLAPAGTSIASFPFSIDDTQVAPAHGIVNGPDCNRYFVLFTSAGYVGRITTDGTVKLWPIPTNMPGEREEPEGITVGPDGHIWFTEDQVPVVGQFAI